MRTIEEILDTPVGELTPEELAAGRRHAGEEAARLRTKEFALAQEAERRYQAARQALRAAPPLSPRAKQYGLTAKEAQGLTSDIVTKVEDFREKHGYPHSQSPLVRGYLLDLMSGKEK